MVNDVDAGQENGVVGKRIVVRQNGVNCKGILDAKEVDVHKSKDGILALDVKTRLVDKENGMGYEDKGKGLILVMNRRSRRRGGR